MRSEKVVTSDIDILTAFHGRPYVSVTDHGHAQCERVRALFADEAARARAAAEAREPDEAGEPASNWPTVADTERWFASIDKAWPYLAKHADHIDGEFNLACGELRRAIAALFAQRDARARAAQGVPFGVRVAVRARMNQLRRNAETAPPPLAAQWLADADELYAWLATAADAAGEGVE